MTEEPTQDRVALGNEAAITFNRDFATVLGSILDSASSMFPSPEGLGLRFSVALVGEMGKDEFAGLARELPVVADIVLSEEIGERAAILTDIRTASVLAGLVSTGEPIEKDALGEDDIASLYDAFNPILDALSTACEEVTGRPLDSIESIEVLEPAAQGSMGEELSPSLCRATASVSIGNKESGQIALVLPLNLAETLAETSSMAMGIEVSAYERAELQEEDPDAYSHAPVPREPSIENIDLILDIQLKVNARLGQVEMPIGEILKLAAGSVIDIDRFTDEPVELVVNDRLVARGEIVVVQENFGIRITQIVSKEERIESLR